MLFDGNAIVHRAFHALPALTVSKTGEVVGAVFGFASILLKVINELKPSHYAIAFDRAAPTFRHEMFAEYKAHRPKTPDELINQLVRVRQLVATLGMPIIELDGYEADDVLGTLSRQAGELDMETIIVTSDADAMQLVAPEVKVLCPKPKGRFSDTTLYDAAAVIQRYGVTPTQITDLKGLVGDASDNISGVPNVGAITAHKLLKQFGDIEQIYAHLDEVSPDRIKNILRENEGIARESKKLATIVTDAPVKLEPEQCRVSHFDRNQVMELFRELNFASLIPRLPEIVGNEAGAVPVSHPQQMIMDF